MKTAEEGYRIKRRLSFQINAGRKTDILNSFFCIILTSTMAADLFAYLEIPFVDKADGLFCNVDNLTEKQYKNFSAIPRPCPCLFFCTSCMFFANALRNKILK